jgi:SAM-dependent methyltransferase
MSFKDHFSRQSAAYSRYRPHYPPELIEWVSSLAPDRRLAVDCATGNGQAALPLSSRFDLVVALDGSLAQLRSASPQPNVAYVAALAECLPIRGHSVSLITAAQAAHWFDFDRFHAECRRVLVPGGVVAAWTYGKFRLDDPDSRVSEAVDSVIDDFYETVLGEFWPPERQYVELGYRTLPFPWPEVAAPAFGLETAWDLERVLGYLASWSAVQRYRDRRGSDPLKPLRVALETAWGGAGIRRLRWPVHARVGIA